MECPETENLRRRTLARGGQAASVDTRFVREAARCRRARGQEIQGEGPFSGSGLRMVEVVHEGNTNASPEEAREVARLAERLAGCSWRDRDDAVRLVGADGILDVYR